MDFLNQILKDRFFGDFYYSTKKGWFLRMFSHKDSWPNTTLVFIDLERKTLEKLVETNSSWSVWTAKYLGDNKYSIAFSPKEGVDVTIP